MKKVSITDEAYGKLKVLSKKLGMDLSETIKLLVYFYLKNSK